MSGKERRFTSDEIAKVMRLRGAGLKWEEVAEQLPGRSDRGCMNAFYNHKEKQQRSQPIAAGAAVPARRPRDAHGMGTSTHRLMVDAELRSRIAEQGVTAGLLGDPLPGRSALDRKRAGEMTAEHVDRRKAAEIWRQGPPVTLAGGPPK